MCNKSFPRVGNHPTRFWNDKIQNPALGYPDPIIWLYRSPYRETIENLDFSDFHHLIKIASRPLRVVLLHSWVLQDGYENFVEAIFEFLLVALARSVRSRWGEGKIPDGRSSLRSKPKTGF